MTNSDRCSCGVQRTNHCDLIDMPVAMAYVPTQYFDRVYPLGQALSVGTIFPCLYKPFCGRRCTR